MKKVLLIIALLVFANCEIKFREVNASENKTVSTATVNDVYMEREYMDGLEYHVYSTGNSSGGVFVVNHTKEKLEVAILKRQLK